jgi:hypothetical protein
MYLIWTIINYAFIILFFALVLALITKGKKLLQNKYGIVTITILFFGFIGLIGDKENTPKNEYVLSTGDEALGRVVKRKRIVVEDNTLFDIRLQIRFCKNASGELIPVFTRSRLNGFVSDYRWNYDYAEITKLSDNSYSYTIYGVLDWYFLDRKLYGQAKEITGEFTLEN